MGDQVEAKPQFSKDRIWPLSSVIELLYVFTYRKDLLMVTKRIPGGINCKIVDTNMFSSVLDRVTRQIYKIFVYCKLTKIFTDYTMATVWTQLRHPVWNESRTFTITSGL